MNHEFSWSNPLVYVGIILQMHLYTGLFITAHDAMHGSVSSHQAINQLIGTLAAGLFAYNSYQDLLPKHHEHHRFVATDKDPDYHEPHAFWPWYLSFITSYIRWPQMLLMGITFWVLVVFFPMTNVILFWMLPSILSTFQLFFFGTYTPHRGLHPNKHKSGTLSKNHLWAFLSCYFFGYHYEHHDSPGTPWWRLWRMK